MPFIKPPPRQRSTLISTNSQQNANEIIQSISHSPVTATVRTATAIALPAAITATSVSANIKPATWSSVDRLPLAMAEGNVCCGSSVASPACCILSFPSPPPDSAILSMFGPQSQSVEASERTTCTVESSSHPMSPLIPSPSKVGPLKSAESMDDRSSAAETFLCGVCGRMHTQLSPHGYDYCETVDADLLCRLCQQPLVDPLDTKCGHTFCSLCLQNHLAVQALCPEDKQIINYLECQQSSNLVKRLLDKLLVACPNSEYCTEVLARCDLESHLAYWCRGTVVACVNQKLGCPYLGFRAQQAAHRWSCQFQPAGSRNTTISTTASSGGELQSVSSDSHLWGPSDSQTELKSPQNVIPTKPVIGVSTDPQLNEPLPSSGPPISVDTIHIDVPLDGHSELGISIVGGCDTPLVCVIIQEIYLDGLAARDGRLRPGDQILEVNGQDFSLIPHLEACRLLSSASGTACRLTIYRESQPFEYSRHSSVPGMSSVNFQQKEEVIRVVLPKCPDKRLGIKLAGKKHCLGLYVLGLLPDGLAQLDGRIRKDDRLLEINDVDLSNGTQDQAAQLISDSKDFVRLVLSRVTRAHIPDILRTSSVGNDAHCIPRSPQSFGRSTNPPSNSTSVQPNHKCSSVPVFHNFPLQIGSTIASGVRVCYERAVVLSKRTGESLGMSVAGGVASQRGDVPIYVTNLHPNGVAAQSGCVFRGDILLAVNEVELLGLSHERAVDALKNARDACSQVTLRLLKGPEECAGERNFIPSWLFWLQLPRYCQIPRLVVLRKDTVLGLGFSIIGGNDFGTDELDTPDSPVSSEKNVDKRAQFPRPIVIKSIVPGSPCFRDGRLKCGDILLSVDQYSLTDISHTHAVALLKHCAGEVKLRIVSWPGTIV